MRDEVVVDEVAEEIDAILADRARMIEARDAHPNLDHWKMSWQLDALDRRLAKLREPA